MFATTVTDRSHRHQKLQLSFGLGSALSSIALAGFLTVVGTLPVTADETCQSPYMPKITGEEEFVYVWTLGVEGMGDGSDKLVTVDVRKGSPTFGKVINASSVGGRGEAHHGGFTDDRRQFWLPDSTTARSIFLT